MNLLLDTHAFIWLDGDKTKLSTTAARACSDPQNTLWLSVASAWEMQIKIALGKLRLQRPLAQIIGDQERTNGIQILDVQLVHVLELQNLPSYHKDPFDRLIIAQARYAGLELLTNDSEFSAYGVPIVW